MFPASIAKEDIAHLPLIRFEGEIHLIDSNEDLETAMKVLKKEKVIGFDTETKPTFNKGDYNATALIQLSTLTEAYIVRVKDLGMPRPLKSLMEDQDLIKVGISITDDLKDLRKSYPLRPAGFVDLNDVAKELGITQIGMRSLSGIFLQSRISKSQQTSNWESRELTAAQLSYAATDAWVCVKIYNMLGSKGYL